MQASCRLRLSFAAGSPHPGCSRAAQVAHVMHDNLDSHGQLASQLTRRPFSWRNTTGTLDTRLYTLSCLIMTDQQPSDGCLLGDILCPVLRTPLIFQNIASFD